MSAGYLIKVQTIIRSVAGTEFVDQKKYYTDTYIKNILPRWVYKRMSDFHINFFLMLGDIPYWRARINKDNRDKTISDFLPKDINITPDNMVVIKILEERSLPVSSRPPPPRPPTHISSASPPPAHTSTTSPPPAISAASPPPAPLGGYFSQMIEGQEARIAEAPPPNPSRPPPPPLPTRRMSPRPPTPGGGKRKSKRRKNKKSKKRKSKRRRRTRRRSK